MLTMVNNYTQSSSRYAVMPTTASHCGWYFSTFAILATYAAWVIRRKRALSRLLRPEDQ